jgi:hypothetical protein
LTSDGRWTYTWDGENRLATMAARTAVGPQVSLGSITIGWGGGCGSGCGTP